MTADPVTLGPEDTLMRAVEVMRKKGIRRIPIVVADTLVGLLAEGDLKRAQPSALVGLAGGVQPRDGGDARLADHDPEPGHGRRGHARSPTPRRRSTPRSSARCPCCATGGWSASSPTPTSSACLVDLLGAAEADGARRGRRRRDLVRRLRAALRRARWAPGSSRCRRAPPWTCSRPWPRAHASSTWAAATASSRAPCSTPATT